uniref:Uncharacterized protein n=1 Tax=Erythrolobus australicus TaxID=1077150 RepID=A0A7S1TMX2_9RHOD
MMRNTSMKMGLGERGGSAGTQGAEAKETVGKRNSSRKFVRGIGSRKELFEANDVEVKNGEFVTKPRRQSAAATEAPPEQKMSKTRTSMRLLMGLPPPNAAAAAAAAAKQSAEGAAGGAAGGGSGDGDDDDAEAEAERKRQMQGGLRNSLRNFSRTKLDEIMGVRRDTEPDLGLVDVNPEDTLAKRAKEMEKDGTQKHSKAYSKIAIQRASGYSAPALIQATFGQSWMRDIFVLPHNAIKEELSETYYLMSVLNRMFTELEKEDIEMFFTHWETTQSFLSKFFAIEEQAIYSRLAKKVTITGILSRKERTATRSQMQRTMQVLKSDFENDLIFLPPSEALSIIKKKIDVVVAALSNYMMMELQILPLIFEQHYTATEKDDIEREVVNFFFNDEDGSMIHILLKWIRDPAWRKYMFKKHFDRKRVRVLMEKGKQYEHEHTNIVKKLNNRSKQVVVEMLEADFAAESVPDFYRNKVDNHFEEEWEYYSDDDGANADGGAAATAATAATASKSASTEAAATAKDTKAPLAAATPAPAAATAARSSSGSDSGSD